MIFPKMARQTLESRSVIQAFTLQACDGRACSSALETPCGVEHLHRGCGVTGILIHKVNKNVNLEQKTLIFPLSIWVQILTETIFALKFKCLW